MQTIRCCKGCVAPKRHIGCHATCKEYIEQSKENETVREKRFRHNQAYTLASGEYRRPRGSQFIKTVVNEKRRKASEEETPEYISGD